MALKDVIQKIPLSLPALGGGSYVPNVDLPLIAESLGLNFDSDTNVMYMGDNPKNGFEFYWDGKTTLSTLWIYLYCDGVRKSGNGDSIRVSVTSENSCLYYIKGKNGSVAFGISIKNAPVFQFICGKSKNLVDGAVKYGYFIDVFSSYENSGTYVLSDGYYKSNWFDSNGLIQTTDYFAQFHPMCSHQGDLFDNVYVATIFKLTTDYQLFTINNKKYLSLNMGKNDGIRYIMEF